MEQIVKIDNNPPIDKVNLFTSLLTKYNISLRHIFSKYRDGNTLLTKDDFFSVFNTITYPASSNNIEIDKDKQYILDFVTGFFINYENNSLIDIVLLFKLLENKKSFVFIVPSYNNIDNYMINMESVKKQIYPRHQFRTIYLLDKSDDETGINVKKYITDNNMENCIEFLEMTYHQRQAFSRFIAFHRSFDDEICINLDGDDWLFDEHVLDNLHEHYTANNILVSYGSYYVYDDKCVSQGQHMGIAYNDVLIGANQIPKHLKRTNAYRDGPWQSVHLRSAYAKLFKSIELRHYIDHEGMFFRMCTDYGEMYPVLEMSNRRNLNICKPMLVYNKYNSQLYDTSFYRKDEKHNKVQQVYRTIVTDQIKSRPYYPKFNSKCEITIEKITPTIKFMSLNEFKNTKAPQLIKLLKYELSDYLFISNNDCMSDYLDLINIITHYYRSKPGAILVDTIKSTDALKNPTTKLETFGNDTINIDNKLFYVIKRFSSKFCVEGDNRNPGKHFVPALMLAGFYNREKMLALLHDDQTFMDEVYIQKILFG